MKQTTQNIPDGYKQTVVGIIPEDWEVKIFDKCFEHLKTYTFSREQLDYKFCKNSIYNIHYGDIHSTFPKCILDTEEKLNLLPIIKEENIEKPVFLKDGDIIMADASEDYAGVGQSIEIINIRNKKIVAGTHTFALRPKIKFAPKYGGHIFSNYNTHKALKKIATGISVFGLSKSNISKIKLPIPPLPEQEKIADCLTTWDTAIEKLSELIKAKKQYKKGIMQQLLTGKKRLEGFTDEWKEVRLGDIANIYQPETISQIQLTEKGYLVYGANGIIGRYSQYNHEKEQIAVVCRGSTCGVVNLTRPKSWITGNAMVINIDYNKDISKYFLYNYLVLDNLSYLITGSGQPQITSDIKKHIIIPPIEEQTAIAEILSTADKEIRLLEEKLASFKAQKKGLMQVLLTGKKRLV